MWGTYRRHCSVVSHQETHTNVLVPRKGLHPPQPSLGGKPHYCVGDAFPTRFHNVYMVTPIMVKGGAEVPDVYGMGVPGATEGGFFLHQYHRAWGSHKSSIEVLEFFEEGVGGKFWVEAKGAE